jgi:endonuclease/exonuclease/phosphatase family metal-dependent hydrolase
VIAELQADVIGLQEVASGDGGQLDHLARVTGLHAIAGPLLPYGSHHLGNALLTRYTAREVRVVPLGVRGREPRAALDVDLAVDGDDWRVVVTHLGLRGHERRAQVSWLVNALEARPAARRTLVMGDVNEWLRVARAIRRLRAGFGGRPVLSFPARWPVLSLDRVFVQPAGALGRVWAHRSPLARQASDHLPVVATVLG